ncbi:class A sortase [Paenibacillus sp. GCM10027626]|uniref:class A sortase n=1 Tax=Paenibacillus sp. GCM10027626 TaxID=3273411 RepID=UPI00362762C0
MEWEEWLPYVSEERRERVGLTRLPLGSQKHYNKLKVLQGGDWVSKKKRRVKNWMYNILSIVLLLTGIFFLAYEPIINWVVSSGTEAVNLNVSDFRKPESIEAQKEEQKEVSYDFNEVEELDLKTVLMAKLNKDDIVVAGGISIPSVHLNLPIGKGTSKYTLALTAGTMKEDQVMGEGNYALAGHHMNRQDLLFSPLFQVKIGAPVYLTDLNYIYEYQIDEQRRIEATEVEVIDDVAGEKLLTLITCTDKGSARLLTRGHFVKRTPVDQAASEILEAFQLDLNNR